MAEAAFDFLEEIQKPHLFRALFPEDKAIRAILWLYARMNEGSFPSEKFKGNDIYQEFQETNKDGQYSRMPLEHLHMHIQDLLEYFILYNDEEKIYSFRDYGKLYCKHAEEALAGNFNPTN